jgi:hypothetical protein
VVTVIFLGLVLSTLADDSGRIQKEKMAIRKFNHEGTNSIGKYSFPLKVNSFLKDLGQPDSTFIDDNESCPVGQIHIWCLRSQNFKILVLGDNYKSKVDYSAESHLFAVAKCETEKETGFNGFLRIRLGDSDRQVIEKLSNIVKQNRKGNLKTNIEGAPIHVLLNSFSVSHHHTIERNNLYFYFLINKQGTLEAIMQSSFDLSSIC